LTDKTYKDKEYWNRLRRSRDSGQQEHVTLDGEDGELCFDNAVLRAVRGKGAIDLGCGIGLFTIEIAKKARNVVGIDFSEEAIIRGKRNLARAKLKNVEFGIADASKLPFSDSQFDVLISRRGPVTAGMASISEAYRVLRRGGVLMEITIGEMDKQNLINIFGRGQMFGVKEKVGISKARLLGNAGFMRIQARDHIAVEVFHSMKDLIIRLNSAPIIPNFNPEVDGEYLAMVARGCTTERGIETPVHRVTITAQR
jgi:SAM-dependent methyltransferase